MTGDARPPAASPLMELPESAGGVAADYHGRRLVRHFGDPSEEYRAATQAVAVFDRSHRTRLVVKGRAPGQMLNGVLTGTLPAAPAARAEWDAAAAPGGEVRGEQAAPPALDGGVMAGTATYHAVLTPKGRMVTDLWTLRLGDEATDGFLLDVPVAGAGPLRAHLGKVLPPRFATVEDASARTAMLTLVGPDAAGLASRLALGLRVEAHELERLAEGEWRAASLAGQSAAPAGRSVAPADWSAAAALLVVRTEEVWPPAYSVLGPAEAVAALWRASVRSGARPAGLGVWTTLRVEAGRPAFGTDMDERTIPVEAGIDARAIDHRKGCYTGQEVIVRIRDRGHVNRHLRRLELGAMPAPAPGTELLPAGESGAEAGAAGLSSDQAPKPVGWITSAVESPRFGSVVALAYVRREVDRVRLGGRTIEVGPAGE